MSRCRKILVNKNGPVQITECRSWGFETSGEEPETKLEDDDGLNMRCWRALTDRA